MHATEVLIILFLPGKDLRFVTIQPNVLFVGSMKRIFPTQPTKR